MSGGKVVLAIVVVLAGVGLGFAFRPSGGESGPGGGGAEAGPTTPAAVAKAWVAAVKARNPADIAAVCAEPVSHFWNAIETRRTMTHKLIEWCREKYPGEGEDNFKRMLAAADRPMTAFYKLKLDGRLPSRGDKHVFQISYENYKARPRSEELVVEKVGDAWRVSSYGEYTPARGLIGAMKSHATKLTLGHERSLEEAGKQKKVDQALEVYNTMVKEIFKHEEDQ